MIWNDYIIYVDGNTLDTYEDVDIARANYMLARSKEPESEIILSLRLWYEDDEEDEFYQYGPEYDLARSDWEIENE